jgi:transcriptional regulator with XRE-family HTH domain
MSSTARHAERAAESESAFGRLFREWRMRRRVSQLDLAVEAGVSSRHVSFIETGRAQPSREMVLMLSRVLDVPLRDRNELLMAAGYAAVYRATDLDAPAPSEAIDQARRALDFMLRQQEPYPAIVVDRSWTLLKANGGAVRLVETFVADPSAAAEWGGNAMRLMFHPRGLRPHIVNWEAMAASLIQWLHRDVLSGLGGAETRGLLDELSPTPACRRAGERSTSTSPPLRSWPSISRRAISTCGTSPR